MLDVVGGGNQMPGRDKYRSFAELSKHEAERQDFQIHVAVVEGSEVAVLAPHGGKIEFLTSELARSIAGPDHNCYAFEGIKRNKNGDLHVTSSNFEEPTALALLASCATVVTVHGLDGDAMTAQVGGRDAALSASIVRHLREAGFDSRTETVGRFAGTDANNICNRGRSGAGAQIEINAGLRRTLQQDQEKYDSFVAAVKAALAPI